MEAVSHRNVDVPIVFFGGAHVGKSTMIGYLLDALSDDYDAQKQNLIVQKLHPKHYKQDQYYAYLVDTGFDEISRGEESRRLGTSKRLHIHRMQSDRIHNDRRIDYVLIDTPGSILRYRDKTKGISLSEIGIFMIDIGQVLRMGAHEARFTDHSRFLAPLKAWLSIKSDRVTIVGISKFDTYDGEVSEIMSLWNTILATHLSEYNISSIVTAIEVKKRNSLNVISKPKTGSFETQEGPLWEVIERVALKEIENASDDLQTAPSSFIVDRIGERLGLGTWIQGKQLSGMLELNSSVKIGPYSSNGEHVFHSTRIRRIEKLDSPDSYLHQSVSGDFVRLFVDVPESVKNAKRSSVLIATQPDTQTAIGTCIEVELRDVPPSLNVGAELPLVRLGKVLPVQVVATTRTSIILQIKNASEEAFCFIIEDGKILNSDIALSLNTTLTKLISGNVSRTGELARIRFVGGALTESAPIEKNGDTNWADEVRAAFGKASVSANHVECDWQIAE